MHTLNTTTAHTTFTYTFDYRAGDVYWCTADCGWITGHTYITYGPLLANATSVMFEVCVCFLYDVHIWVWVYVCGCVKVGKCR